MAVFREMLRLYDEKLRNVLGIDERELALLCSKGDSEAIRELYNRYAARLRAVCSRYSGGPVEGMDLTHDTIIKALREIGRFNYKGKGSLFAWLKKLAVNLAIDRLRRDGRLDLHNLTEDILIAEPPEPEVMRSVPLTELLRMISELPEAKRLVFNMFCFDGFSHKEIASRLGISEKSSSSTLAKAKKLLIAKLETWKNG